MGSICGLKVVDRFGLSDQTTNGGVFLKGGGGVGWMGKLGLRPLKVGGEW